MAVVKVQADVLDRFCMDVFDRFGFSESDSRIITDVLLLADLYGIESHGAQRLVRYHKGIASGRIKVDAKPEIIHETPVSAVIDGHAGMGQLMGHYGMSLCIEKAKKSGMAMVSVRNSNHYGIAGYYAKMASDQGLIGISCTNSEAIVTPTFGKKAMIGTNPRAFAMPPKPYPFFFDAATSIVTRGKFEIYRKAEEPVPEGWGVDENGKVCTDPGRVLDNINARAGGGILPLGGAYELTGSHKGYGNAMIVEILSSILSLGLTSNHTNIGTLGGTCHGFAVIDPAIFGDPDAIIQHLSDYLEELRESPKADGHDKIYTHGQKEVEGLARRKKEGVDVDMKTLDEMKDMSEYVGADFMSYFADVYRK